MNDINSDIWAAAQSAKGNIIAGLQEFVQAGVGGERAIQDLFTRKASLLGCEITPHAYYPTDVNMVEEFAGDIAIDPEQRTSLVAHFKASDPGRSLILFAHPDGETNVDTSGWAFDPYAGTIDQGRMYGWGVADDLSGIAAGLQALELLRSLGVRPSADVYVASTPSKRHARGVAYLLQNGLHADGAVYLHPAESGVGMKEIKAFTSGQLEFRIEIEGQQPPSTEPLQTAFAHQGVNAIDKAFLIWKALKNLDEKRAEKTSHPALDSQVGRSTNLMMSYISSGDPKRLSKIAERCTIGAALAFPPPETLGQICAEIEAAVEEAAMADEWMKLHPPRIIWDSGVTGAEVVADHPLVASARSAVLAVSQREPWINPMHTGSDIRVPNVQKGIPTIGLGPLCGDLSQNGGSDEWVDVDDHVKFVAAIAATIAGWCGVEASSPSL